LSTNNKPSPHLRIAYFINQYPRISHAFIRREILALEQRGVQVQRIALRGWDANVLDETDERERARTRYVLGGGFVPLVWALLRTLLSAPGAFLSGLILACRMGWRGERPLAYHLAYLAEACWMLPRLKSFGASHVHAHFGTNSAEIVMLARALGGPPYSFTVHGPTEFDRPQYLGLGEKIRRSAFVVAITSFGRSQLCRWIEHEQWSKIKVIHCGLEADFFQIPMVPPPVEPRLVCIGRLVEQKGQLLLIEAARRLVAKDVSFELALVGDGELRTEIESLVTRYGLGKQVRITGSVTAEQLREEILRSRALVLPSFAEGLPMVLMEAMALHRPVITTYVAGIPELVRPREHGWLVPAGSVDALVEAIEDCVSLPIEALRAMGQAAHVRVTERHSVDAQAAQLAELFGEVRP
jgi:colanic acid/amylovoran biosynthesis glycosyltransferase